MWLRNGQRSMEQGFEEQTFTLIGQRLRSRDLEGRSLWDKGPRSRAPKEPTVGEMTE